MTELVVNHMPRGEGAARELVAAIAERGDAVERHYLEVKSDVDLGSKAGQAKLAKFILGAANRRPDVATRAFDGYGIIVFGVSKGQIDGIPPIDTMELKRGVELFISADGPNWDFLRLPLPTGNEVFMVMVDPPKAGDPIRICYKDGLNISDGAIYFRADGDTRNAKGREVDQLVARARAGTPEADIDVRANGHAQYVASSEVDTLEARISDVSSRHSLAYTLATSAPASNLMAAAGFGLPQIPIGFKAEPRTREQYDRQLESWAREMREIWQRVVDDEAARRLSWTVFQVENNTESFLEDVEVRIHLEGEVDALKGGVDMTPGMLSYLPRPPRLWGPVSIFDSVNFANVQYAASSFPAMPSSPSSVNFKNSGSVDIHMAVGALRPRQTWSAEDEGIVLILRKLDIPEVNGTWTMTARDHHRVYSGTLTVPVGNPLDLTPILRRAIMQTDG